MEKLVSLCKRRGIVFPSSEIYGGVGSFWDYGPLGVEIKQNIKELWWEDIVNLRDDVVGVETSIIMHPDVWLASGHVGSFYDSLVDCKVCKKRYRLDHLSSKKCPECGGELTEARNFNLMFETHIGPVEKEASKAYLRPETAQGIFVDFSTILNCSRQKIPFGIAQVGKSFRNEVSPGNFIFRSREFEQMELEYFVAPQTDEEWFKYWLDKRFKWYVSLGIKKEKLRLRKHNQNELAHYAKECYDIEYEFPFGWQELEGIANRSTFDLEVHIKRSGKDLSYFDEKTKERFIPVVIETSAGVDRTLLALLVDAYNEEEVEGEQRVILRFHPRVAPIKAGVFPLVRKGGLAEKAQDVEKMLRPHFATFYDEVGSIGRRYRRQDEVGTPYGITIDFQTLKDDTVTVRYRDSMDQDRVKIPELRFFIEKKIENGIS